MDVVVATVADYPQMVHGKTEAFSLTGSRTGKGADVKPPSNGNMSGLDLVGAATIIMSYSRESVGLANPAREHLRAKIRRLFGLLNTLIPTTSF